MIAVPSQPFEPLKPMPLQAGTMLTPTIRLDRELGHGGMGAVWVATNVSLGSEVAVKVLRDARASRERFEQEARGMAQIDSPHVVKVFDYGVTADGEPYIVMELLRGKDLRDHIEARGALPKDETLEIVTQVCRALGAAHERRIVHRDIKPANIFLCDVGSGSFVKVLDFGVAKFLGSDLGMTSTGALMGTPYYASPEQLLTPKDVDHRTDLWSLAVATYACLTGQLPFVAETLAALSLKINSGEFPPPTRVRSDLPPALDLWMKRALNQRPEQRFESASKMAEALELALRGGTGADLTTGTVMMTPAGPAPAAPTLGTGTVVASPGSVPSAHQWQPPPQHQPMGQSTLSPMAATDARHRPVAVAPPKRSPVVPILAAIAVLGLAGAGFVVVRGQGDVSSPEAQTDASDDDPKPAKATEEAPDTPTAQSDEPEDPEPPEDPDAEAPPPEPAPSASVASPAPAPVVAPRPRPRPRPAPPPSDDNPFKTRR